MAAKEGGAMLKAIASRSTNFSLTDALWMKDNYVVTAGLANNGEDEPAEQPATAEIGEAAEAQEQADSDAEDEGAPEEEAAGSMNTL